MKNGHAPGMCLLDDALNRDANDHAAQYNKATILEAYGVYDEALALYATANESPDLQKGRWKKGTSRMNERLNDLKLMDVAYGMKAKPTSFPYAESCPELNTEGTIAVTKRTGLHVSEKGEMIRKLHEGELLRIIQEGKKWAHVQQLDGSEGWINAKKAFK